MQIKTKRKANGNFVNADTDKQNAYNNAVAHAEQIISGTPNANVDPQQVAQALQQVNQGVYPTVTITYKLLKTMQIQPLISYQT